MNKKTIIAITMSVLLLAVGVIFLSSRSPSENNQVNFSVQEASSLQDLETFLAKNKASEEVKEAYRFAQENPEEVLSKVKCYCGCLEQDHKNNRDCFINEDGTFDLMGLNCGLCVKTALVSKAMLTEGKSVQEISDYVDARWGKSN